METRETKNCPYCGEEIMAVAKKCKHCGEWLPEDEELKETLHEEQPELTPVESEPEPQSETQELPNPETQESPAVTSSETVLEDTSTETPQMKAEQPHEKKSKRGYLLFAAIGVLLLLGVIWSLTSKTEDVDAELKAEADRVNAVVAQIERGEEPEGFVETDNTYIWEKGYLKDEFGEEVKSSPFIKTTFSGEGVRGEAKIEFLFSKTNGLILTIYGCNYTNYVDCVIKVKLGEIVDQLIPTDVDGTSILFQDMEQIRKIIELLECGEELKLSILMKTGYTDMNSSFLFSIYGNKDVKKALASIGIELGYDGNYDYHGEAPGEDDYSDPTTLDQETLQNRVYDEE